MPSSHFTDDRDYVITSWVNVGERQRTINFVWKDGSRGSVTIDVSYDNDDMRDRLIRAWNEKPRQRGANRTVIGDIG